MSHDTPENNLKSYDGFSSHKHKNTTGQGKEVGASGNQEVMGSRDRQNREEEIKGTKQNSKGCVRGLCLGSCSKETFQELLTQRSRN